MQLSAHVRRLAADGDPLYLRLDDRELYRAGLADGQAVAVTLPDGATIHGVIKTSGVAPWLAPGGESSNASITHSLRMAGFEHGHDIDIEVAPE